jgi:hypothetical protein
MIKHNFIFLMLLFHLLAFSQKELYQKILFDKNIKAKELHLDDDQTNETFPNFLFENTNFSKVTSYYIVNNESASIISENKSSLLECEFVDVKSYLRVKDKIQKFRVKNYENFNANFEYKGYSEYIQKGLIIVFNKTKQIMLMININSCLDKKQKQKIIKLLQNKEMYNVFIFNCGGKVLITEN